MQPNLKTNNGELSKNPTATVDSGRASDTIRHRSQSPQEALGLSGQSGLFKASLQAGALFAVVFGVLTVIPYFMQKQQAAAKLNAPPEEKTETPPETVAPAPKPAPNPEPTPKTPTGPKVPGKDDLLNKLGETGTKSGTPKSKDPFKAGGEDDLPGLK
ncbi:MAG: hypothetical protein C0467_01780 [Planctomycetaceae bacterium]|nr:hypothetical protein [Planctomycetaceae bacterium]